MSWISHQPLRIIGEVCKRVAELVCKLKAVLSPISILGRQTYRNAAVRLALEIGLRMIRSIVHVDTGKLGMWTMSPNFAGSGLQYGSDIGGTNLAEPCRLHFDIERLRGGTILCCSYRNAQSKREQPGEHHPCQ